MADKGKGKMIEEEISSNSSSPSRMDTMLAFLTSTDEKERKRINNERDDYELHRDKRCLDAQYSAPMELWVQLDLNKPLPAELLNEVEVVPAAKADNNNICEKVDAGSCSITVEKEEVPLRTNIAKKKRRMPKENYARKTSTAAFQCLQGSSSASMKHQEENRIIPGRAQLKKDRQYYDEPNKQIKKTRKPCRAVKRQRAAAQLLQPEAPALKRRRAAAQLVQPAGQPIPGDIKEAIRRIGGVDIIWVSEKVITKSDTERSQNRLLLPSNCYDFLQRIMTDDEKIQVFELDDHGLHIKLVDQNQKVWDMDLRYWPGTQGRVFTKNWNKFVKHFVLVPEKDKVQIWCFRIPAQGMRLCFGINIVRPPAPGAVPAPEAGPVPAVEAAQGPQPEPAP